ncbi:surfeit locus protein 6 [Megalobrama amblycephala]|uniref:surfeit locus protein 6 n=1 Tax=Megalobrama amblycephala TaxID=75352 RepID=UPI0020147E81|nr:surfeit locus protein 6 [Megalobrama amblycephala]
MASLAAKYDYLEKLTRKVCVSQKKEPKKRPYVPFRGSGVNDGAPPKKKKNKQNPTKGDNMNASKNKPVSKSTQPAVPPAQRKPVQNGISGTQKKPEGGTSQEFNAVDILRQRLHQKIEESRGQGPPKDPSSDEVKKKREKRKQERERRKRKKKEFRMKKLADAAALQAEEDDKEAAKPELQVSSTSSTPAKKEQSFIVFNKMEVGEDYVDKGTKLIQDKKKRKVKGILTPLTGKNYKQLLTRIEARKDYLEQLREKDEGKAQREEEKMKWTNVLYKAEGMKIKDNEELLHASLKKKEKRKAQKKKKWTKRSQQVVEQMQKRQDKRKRNIKQRKDAKIEKRKQRARKKGRVLPGDIKKADL